MSSGQLAFVGLGLYDENDISLKGLEELKQCDKIFAEFYTSKLVGFNKISFEKRLGKTIEVLSREETEKGNHILEHALREDVVFLTCGDPMIATTHVDLRLRALKSGIRTKIVHCASVVTAVPGLLGLQSYKFGRATTLAFAEGDYFPMSPYNVLKENKERGLHTLVLLDIQAEEGRYMTANEGLLLLLDMEAEIGEDVITEEGVVCVVARAGSSEPVTIANTVKALRNMDFGRPLHTLVVPGVLHFMEVEALELFSGLPKKVGKKLQKL